MKYHLFVITEIVLAVVAYLLLHDLLGFDISQIADIAIFVALYMSYAALRRVYRIEEELENAVSKKKEER